MRLLALSERWSVRFSIRSAADPSQSRLTTILVLAQLLATGCTSQATLPDVLSYDVVAVDEGPDAPSGPTFCSLSGDQISGAVVPSGMCIRRVAFIDEPRTLAFAPNGDLFVGAPQRATAGGADGGPGEIIALADDNHDGIAEIYRFATGIADVHGIGFGNGYLYFTTATQVFRTPYTTGQRVETGPREAVGDFEQTLSARWTHGLAVTARGTVFATTGVESEMVCPNTPRAGLIQRVGQGSMELVASGFRNPMYLRCHERDEVCLASELGDDGGMDYGAHEKLVLIRSETNYGFPCCATTGIASSYNSSGRFNCSSVTREEASFPLNDTPFGLDWERGHWPLPYRNSLVVALHGSFYSDPQWHGARIVFGPTDPTTHAPTGEWYSLVLGFGPNGSPLERPSDIAFAPDGRMFFSDDHGNAIYWVAPETLRMAQR